jgi:hypothetical protein
METLRSKMDLPFSSAMARSASDGVERSTKAYPTGRDVRGLVGMEVDSLFHVVSFLALSFHRSMRLPGDGEKNLHQIVLEELLQLPLGGRISEVPNIKSPTLSCTGDDGLVFGRRLGISWVGIGESSVCHLGGDTIDRSGHFD